MHLHFGWSQPPHFEGSLQKVMEMLCSYHEGAWGEIWPLALSAEVAKALLAQIHYELGRQPQFVNTFEKYKSKLISVYIIRVRMD